MSNKIIVTSAVKLTPAEIKQIQTLLGAESKELVNQIDATCIAGIKITVNGQTVDMTVKHQLLEIENG